MPSRRKAEKRAAQLQCKGAFPMGSMRMPTGHFGLVNWQPVHSPWIGLLTGVIASVLALRLGRRGGRLSAPD